MSKNNAIQIFLRVRPTKQVDQGFKIDKDQDKVQFFIPKDQDKGYVNNIEQKWIFNFNGVFDMDTKQDRIFDKIAKDVVDSAIQGFNGTIFAYGQTGSGKTYTMTGGSDSYNDRGIIPRTLSYVFELSKNRQQKIQVFISYIQIYGGAGYDLLDPNNTSKKLSDLPRVVPRQTQNGQMILHNLGVHRAQNQQDALNLLFIGDTNRVVSKTPMNDESTRSHCIFIIRIQSSKPSSDVKVIASVHLVDLSGSQRIKQTGVQGLLQKQARGINLGLHFLEHVIICLNKKSNGQNIHVPYRQSLMTMILRDSIGGNCKTRMIATMSAKSEDIKQSIATCKFAQRVALIKNNLKRNQAVDPKVIIQRLKRQNAQLKAQLALLKGGQVKQQLDKYQIQDCQQKVKQYIQNDDPQAAIILSDRLKINQCFYYFKNLYKDALKGSGGVIKISNQSKLKNNISTVSEKEKDNGQDTSRANEQIKRLKLLVQQRDNQIALLLSLIHKKKGQGPQISIPVKRNQQQQNLLLKSIVKQKPMTFKQEKLEKMIQKQQISTIVAENKNNTTRNTELQQIQSMLLRPLNLSSQQLLNHTVAFQQFRKAYRKQTVIKQNQAIMKKKLQEGKELGKIVNQARQEINHLKSQLQKIRTQMAVESLTENKEVKEHPAQFQINKRMDQLKQIYKKNYEKLKQLKSEITTIQNLLKKNTENLQRDFQRYLAFYSNQRKENLKNVQPSILASNIQDQQVQKHLESFFKARDQIRKK